MSALESYRLSLEADRDMDEIFDYTHQHFGLDQAVHYVSELDQLFGQLVRMPDMGRPRNEIMTGLRSFPKSSHVIFYKVMPDCVWIVRVLHASRDFVRFLE